jgi:hypothetical protein
MWYGEVKHQMGTEKALVLLEQAFKTSFGIQMSHLGKLFGFEMVDGIPSVLLDMEETDLAALKDRLAKNWLVNDGVWFQTIEQSEGQGEAKRCNDSCWAHFSPFEARTISRRLGLTDDPGLEGLKRALGFRVYASINEQSLELDALTREDAAAETPGVAEVQQSFNIIFLLYGLVVPCVTGLFFLIVTFQKANSLTLLRAIGAPAGRLVSSLLLQVVVIVGAGLLIGTLLYLPVSQQALGGIALRFETRAVVVWSVLLLTLGVLSSLVAARRVLRIDPIEATTGQGVGT